MEFPGGISRDDEGWQTRGRLGIVRYLFDQHMRRSYQMVDYLSLL